ncbi:hypothetical protein MATL_G00022040 [Megalops atlanticus]|uniref:Uncharacterized protein n=1 Tax=Megalops atlanticus TaxID=7932 RepID=A0A9D3QBB0_MEGAT|nr:hypothetical protein MATL_G00022040 [Megalops atlanticus]
MQPQPSPRRRPMQGVRRFRPEEERSLRGCRGDSRLTSIRHAPVAAPCRDLRWQRRLFHAPLWTACVIAENGFFGESLLN